MKIHVATTKDRYAFIVEHRGTLAILFALCFFFLCMDLTLYRRILEIPPNLPTSNNNTRVTSEMSINPFVDLSIKVMMMDPVDHYIHTVLAVIFNKVTHFSTTFYFISPNFVSFCGILFAIAATKFILSDNLTHHWLAVFLLQVRCWFDALDGIVARSRLGIVKNISLRSTWGYAVDGIADATGYTIFLFGCFFYFLRFVPKQRSPSKKEVFEKDSRWTPLRIYLVVLVFGVQLLFAAGLWNRYIEKYYSVLETQHNSEKLSLAQNEMLKSPVTLIVIYMWRILSSQGLMQIFMAAILLHKHWDFLLFIQFIGFAVIFVAFVISEINLYYIKNYLATI